MIDGVDVDETVLDDDATALLGAAAGVDGDLGAQAEGVKRVQSDDAINAAAAGWYFVPDAFGQIAEFMYPELAGVYTENKKREFAKNLALVAEKRGWNASNVGPEFGLFMCGVTFSIPVIAAHSARVKEKKARQAEESNTTGGVVNGSRE